mgnify:CR=1 FL=1
MSQTISAGDEKPSYEGMARKRGGRMSRWANRYFALVGPRLEYRQSKESTEVRATFDLAPGCHVTDIKTEGKKMHMFWVVWPYDKGGKEKGDMDDEDDDLVTMDYTNGANNNSNINNTGASAVKSPNNESKFGDTHSSEDCEKKDNDYSRDTRNVRERQGLKQVLNAQQQQQMHTREKKSVKKQIERHHKHDTTVGMVPKVAAVALGGIVVTAFTAGFGLIPYLTLFGGFAVAGGSTAALNYRRPLDSRLIMACDTIEEAEAWKSAIEKCVVQLEKQRSPVLPDDVDPYLLLTLQRLNSKKHMHDWNRIKIMEGVSVLDLKQPLPGFHCRSARSVIRSTPIVVFLAVMEKELWPRNELGSMTQLQIIDNNTDLIEIELNRVKNKDNSEVYEKRKLYLNRFWKLTDEGIYLVTLNGISVKDIAAQDQGNAISMIESKNGNDSMRDKQNQSFDPNHEQPLFNAVITISPRKDNDEYDDDVPEAMVTCVVQVSDNSYQDNYPNTSIGLWADGEWEAVLEDFMYQHLIELKQVVLMNRYFSGPENGEDVDGNGNDSKVGNAEILISSVLRPPSSLGGNALGPLPDSMVKNNRRYQDESKSSSDNMPPRPEPLICRPDSALGPIGIDDLTNRKKVLARSQLTVNTNLIQYSSIADGIVQLGSTTSTPLSSKSKSSSRMQNDKSPARLSQPKNHSVGSPLGGKRERDEGGFKMVPLGRRRQSFHRSRSSLVNNEASALRGQIAAREYELGRLEKVARKKNEPSAPEAMVLVHHQSLELQQLKSQYQKLTGTPYEHVSYGLGRRGTITRKDSNTIGIIRGSGDNSTSTPSMRIEYTQLLAPPHWQPNFQSENATTLKRGTIVSKTRKGEKRSHNERRTNLAAMLLFLLCVIVTIMLANLLSTLTESV